MNERETILGLLRLGWSERRVAREGGFHRATVRRCRVESGIEPAKCTSDPKVPTDPKPTTESKVAADSGKSRSACESYLPFIVAECHKGRNATGIYQDLVEHHAYDGAYDAVKHFVRTLRKDEPKISCRFETPPGVEMQFDFTPVKVLCAPLVDVAVIVTDV
jgi:hypothetical protein